MSTSVILACLWVLAATGVAFLPMRWQMRVGPVLLVAAFLLIWMLARAHGVWVALAAFVALVSMFRRPLVYYARKLTRGPT